MTIDELHVHSDASLLDGKQQVHEIVDYAKKNNIAITLTEHGNMVNTYKMYEECKKQGVKCNIGCEMYFTPSYDQQGYTHLILIAKNKIGYKNLLKLQYYSYSEGFYYKPRIDMKRLEECKEGLICLSACIGGIIPQMYLDGNETEAINWIVKFKSFFCEDFYLEIQPHSFDKQVKTNKWLIEMSKAYNIPLVVTSDAHYVNKEERDIHDTVISIGYHKLKYDETRRKYQTTNAFNSEEEITKALLKQDIDVKTILVAIQNTKIISNKCNVDLECSEIYLPTLSDNDNKKLALICNKKFVEKRKKGLFKDVDEKEVIKRVKYELSVLKEKDFSGYFLIVYDFMEYMRNNNIPFGPGRGSVAGSEVAYLLGIHKLEPIKYGLIFERFLNPTRNGYPDIDSDVCYEERGEVIKYLQNKYGKNNTATVMAIGHMTTSNVIRKVLSTYGYEQQIINNVSTKYVPKRLGITLKEAYDESEDLRKFLDSNEKIKRDCFALENNISHFSKHAAGLIISSKPIYECVPVMRDEDNHSMLKTQWDKKIVEKCGLIKFDMLGLKMLTTYGKMLSHIKRLRGIDLTLDELYEIDLENKDIYRILNSGNLGAVFQFSEYAGKRTVIDAKPQCFEDVMACESICRPGVKEDKLYISNKQLYDKSKTYPVPSYWDFVKHILEPTYGALIFQEQTMFLFNEIGGFTLGEADSLRKVSSLEPYRERFINNAIKIGLTLEHATKLFNRFDLAYSFNKSHAGVYGIHSCVNAYCKHNYFTEYMSAYMSMEMLKDDKKSNIDDLIMECRENGIKFLPPDINIATDEFIPMNSTEVMLPITFIKGMGEKAIETIIKHRPYTSVQDLLDKVPKRNVNKTTFQKLAKSGSFDVFDTNRQNILNKYSDVLDVFWCDEVKMNYERETLGMTLGKHPLDNYINVKVSNYAEDTIISINAIINSVTCRPDKKGNMMAFVKCENKVCSFEGLIFSYKYETLQPLLLPQLKVNIQGKVSSGKILIDKMKIIS